VEKQLNILRKMSIAHSVVSAAWIDGTYKINSEENYQDSESLQEEFNTKH
jgi:hypothetical protein